MVEVCMVVVSYVFLFVFFKQKTAYEMRISDWSSDVCSSDLAVAGASAPLRHDPFTPPESDQCPNSDRKAALTVRAPRTRVRSTQIGRASCRERVCQYV